MFTVEMTDTFAGEANYCWVVRETINAKTMSGALRVFKRKHCVGRTRKQWDCGDARRYKVTRANVCIFVSWEY